MRTHRLLLSAAALACVAGSGAAHGALLDPFAEGVHLKGAVIRIDWVAGPGAPGGVISTSGIVMAMGLHKGVATIMDPFGLPSPGAMFVVDGDTSVATWSLVNTTDSHIVGMTIDLRPSISLFDNSSAPSSMGSSFGVLGATTAPGSTAPDPTSVVEVDPWMDPMNLGDMFHGERFLWAPPAAGPGFGPGMVYNWFDDTDIPAPSALALLGAGAIVAGRRRR
jgi:MYXO-CTERM domain-containing protein